ncbi:MAG: hypothetical protein IT371_23215 [Deltaproteobacteria bacterium]|nr:hypothetical protein [Deltaproteobacteria bacterium]
MTSANFGKEAWVELFHEVGLDDEAMHRWHVAFEKRWPEAHGSFLAWLGLGEPEVERIRTWSRAG